MLVLTIPLISLGLLQEIEKTLVESLKDNLALSSQLIAGQLVNHSPWYDKSLLPDSNQFVGKELFVFPLSSSFNLDGYFDEWKEHEKHRITFAIKENSISVLLGSDSGNLVLSVIGNDTDIIFPNFEGDKLSDRLEIELKNDNGIYQKLFLSPSGTGEFAVQTRKKGVLRHDWRYKAFWLNTLSGFNLELKLPSGIRPSEIKVTHFDVDTNKPNNTISTSSHDLNPMVWPAQEFVGFLDSLNLKPAQRVWLLDHYGRVLASSGNLQTSQLEFSSNVILNWFLTNQAVIGIDPRSNNLHLDSEEIYRAMKGQASTRIEYLKGSDNAIAVSAYPVVIKEQVKGVLLLEENVAKVQVLQKKALLKIFATIIVIFLLVVWIIFWYVNRTVGRIHFLNKEIDKVIDEQGRMTSPLSLDLEEGDEISQLYNAFSQMGDKLFEYNEYLEKLASRLSHELRTPLAIVRSSLDNLSLNCQTDEDKELIDRALEGNQRLGEIITRMKQATGVRDAMQTATLQWISLDEFVQNMVKGYAISFPDYKFEFDSCESPIEADISKDLFSELLDKLLANAMEFCEQGQPIKIGFTRLDSRLALEISNSGPLIKKKYLKRIFHSLVSIRTNLQSTGTNLGLGLYVVRLISEYHGFTTLAKNRDDKSGVIFKIMLQ